MFSGSDESQNMEKMILNEIQDFLDIHIHVGLVPFEVLSTQKEKDYERQLISYLGSEQDEIRAYLFIPRKEKIIGSVLVHHQHNGERHLGKSEVAGIAGDPNQYFCPELARRGILSLAPDSICFEDRRSNKKGIAPAADPDDDFLQHYNEMCYRILRGESLMKKVIEDSSIGISLLSQLAESEENEIGILGHSYGGNTVVFHSPFDDRIQYTCSSGAVCSYKRKFKKGTGIEMAEVIPGFTKRFDIGDLLELISPRKLLILSASEDKFSEDAATLYEKVKAKFTQDGGGKSIVHKRYLGGHGLDKDRFEMIVNWYVENFRSKR